MPVGSDPVGGGVQVTNDGRGTYLPGAAEGTGALQVVWGRDGGGIIGGSQDDTSWASGRVDMDLGNLGHGVRAADVPYALTIQGGGAELPGGGMPRTSGDKDDYAGTFYTPACPRHRGHFG